MMRPHQPKFLRPVIFYFVFAFIIYFLGNIKADHPELLPAWVSKNVVFYSINSLVRFACFSIYFEWLQLRYYKAIRRLLPFISILFVVVYFTFFENFYDQERISSKLLTVEAYLLLVYCLLYYLSQLKEEIEDLRKRKDFFVTTGLGFYVAINFFVFLFYDPLFDLKMEMADKLWDIHNVGQIIFSLLIAKAFYVPVKNT